MTVKLLYSLTLGFGVLGFFLYWTLVGFLPALAFLLGALVSLGNLWLFQWLARSISPDESARKPWQAGAFFGRYLILFTLGYAIVKALGVNPLPVVFGLFASTAAVLSSSVVELIKSLLTSRRTN